MEELEMICGALSGDHAAFTALVETYQTPVFNLCYRMLGDRCKRAQRKEAFLRAYSRLRSHDRTARFKRSSFPSPPLCCRLRSDGSPSWVDDGADPVSPGLRSSSQPAGIAEQGEAPGWRQELLQELPA
jgi:RNA polymerase sigma-70 factor (ECF subfamily)